MKPETTNSAQPPASTTAKMPVSKWVTMKRKMKRILYWSLFLLVLLLGVIFYWKYFYTYSEGYRAGLLQKFSRKGTVFKTYEGELILSSVSGRSDVVIASEKFYFSVTDQRLANNLDTLQGRNVIVHYRQKNAALIWKGDTPYYVDSVMMR
jgi:hypothetical protein